MNDHWKFGLEVLGEPLRTIVERHIEQPAGSHLELRKPMSCNVGRGRREAVRPGRDNPDPREPARTIGVKELRALVPAILDALIAVRTGDVIIVGG